MALRTHASLTPLVRSWLSIMARRAVCAVVCGVVMFIAKSFARLPIALAARPRNYQLRLKVSREAAKPPLTLSKGSVYGAAKEHTAWPTW